MRRAVDRMYHSHHTLHFPLPRLCSNTLLSSTSPIDIALQVIKLLPNRLIYPAFQPACCRTSTSLEPSLVSQTSQRLPRIGVSSTNIESIMAAASPTHIRSVRSSHEMEEQAVTAPAEDVDMPSRSVICHHYAEAHTDLEPCRPSTTDIAFPTRLQRYW